jgi:hypothetical protein
MALIITFNIDATRAPAMVEAVKQLGEWGVLTPTSYLVATDMRPGEIMERLHGFVSPQEDLWVITVNAPWAGYGNVEVDDHSELLLGASDDWTIWDWNEVSSSRPKVL